MVTALSPRFLSETTLSFSTVTFKPVISFSDIHMHEWALAESVLTATLEEAENRN
jgi:hypothetical protein